MFEELVAAAAAALVAAGDVEVWAAKFAEAELIADEPVTVEVSGTVTGDPLMLTTEGQVRVATSGMGVVVGSAVAVEISDSAWVIRELIADPLESSDALLVVAELVVDWAIVVLLSVAAASSERYVALMAIVCECSLST